MHSAHDWARGRLAQDRIATAHRRAATRRLQVATGADLHTRTVSAVGAVVDRLRAADVGRRDRAAQAPTPTIDGSVGLVRVA